MKKIDLFVGGPGRTNTTILGEIFGKADDVIHFRETQLISTLFQTKNTASTDITKKSVFNEECKNIFLKDNWWEIKYFRKLVWQNNKINLEPFKMKEDILSLDQWISKNIDSFQNCYEIVDVYFDLVLNWFGERKYIFKMPGIEILLYSLLSQNKIDSASIRIVYTTKNLFDVATSWFRNQLFYGDTYDNVMERLEERMIQSCQSIINFPSSSVLFVTDDELYDKTEETISKISSFLNITPESDSLKLYKKKNRKRGEGQNDSVTKLYYDRIALLQKKSNSIMGNDYW